MRQKQEIITRNLGNDTHHRTLGKHYLNKQSTETFEILTGEILFNQPEPAFKQNMVTVQLTRGGRVTACPLPGAFIDPITGNLHGSYEGLIPGQMVTVGFVNGNSVAPIVLNKYPYQGVGNTLTESSYITPMYIAGYDCTDTLMGHFTGSVIGLYTGINPLRDPKHIPGSIGIEAFTACNISANTDILLDALVSAEVKANIVKLTGTAQALVSAAQVKIDGSATVEINGNTKQFVTWTELNTQLQLLMTALAIPMVVTGTASGGLALTATATWAVEPTLDITTAKTTKTLCGA